MEPKNAFMGRHTAPQKEDVASALGSSGHLWDDLVGWAKENLQANVQEWKGSYPDQYGWTLRLKHGARNLIYLVPQQGSFTVAFSLGDRAWQAAKEAHLPRNVAQAVEAAPRYPEGAGIRLHVKAARDLSAVKKLAGIKAAN